MTSKLKIDFTDNYISEIKSNFRDKKQLHRFQVTSEMPSNLGQNNNSRNKKQLQKGTNLEMKVRSEIRSDLKHQIRPKDQK